MHLLQGTVTFNGVTIFKRNTAMRNGGALYAFRTVIYLNHEINFTHNFAQNGGAICLDGFAYNNNMSINLNTNFHSFVPWSPMDTILLTKNKKEMIPLIYISITQPYMQLLYRQG